ncbi:MAG TPA: hypothetical protein VHB68_11200 [Steroidobacteraceae bacterium]|nr:hypothetical protein [Steroidobacteraceae bacterium]
MFRGSAWLARLALGTAALGCLGCAGVIIVSGRLSAMSTVSAVAVMAVLVATALASGGAALLVHANGVRRIALELIAFAVALLAADVLVRIVAPEPASIMEGRVVDAAKLDVPFDGRTKSEVVADLRAHGKDALPGISREWPRLPYIRQQLPDGLFPLSHASNAAVVECNESGRYLVYHTDELGFNNPPGLIRGHNVQVAAVGASFTLGHCVPDGQGLVARLRQFYPQLADFGMAGSSAVSMLASFREYVEPLRPPIVLWIMHPLTADTRDEMADPILRRYLEPDFSQHLLQHVEEIDQAWRNVAVGAQYELDYRVRVMTRTVRKQKFSGILTLSALRWRLHLNERLAKPEPPPDLGPFQQIIALAQHTTQSWGGRFIVVIVPLYAEVVAHDLPEPLHHDRLAALLRGMRVEVIDTVPAFLAAPDPEGLYVMRRNNHPTPQGHELLARYVIEQMQGKPVAATLAASRGQK